MSPFELLMGYQPRILPSTFTQTNVPTVAKRFKFLQTFRDEAAAAMEMARQKVRERIKKKFAPFKKGLKVWLKAKNLKLNTPNQKLSHKREGPFPIKEVLYPLVYKLGLLKTWKIHLVF